MSSRADTRGWGPGWPNCVSSHKLALATATRSGVKLLVREEIAPIVTFLLNETEARGYLFDHGPMDPTDDWGFCCRPIAGTSVPSNHSWGLAVDLDASKYPQHQTRLHLPQWVIDLWNQYLFDNGVYWANPDPMHMEFRGTPADAAFLVASLAAHHVANTPPTVPPSAPTVVSPAPSPAPIPVQEDDMRLIRNSNTGAIVALYADGSRRAVTGEAAPELAALVGAPREYPNQRAWDLVLSYYPTDHGVGGGN